MMDNTTAILSIIRTLKGRFIKMPKSNWVDVLIDIEHLLTIDHQPVFLWVLYDLGTHIAPTVNSRVLDSICNGFFDSVAPLTEYEFYIFEDDQLSLVSYGAFTSFAREWIKNRRH